MPTKITVKDIIKNCKLVNVGGESFLNREVATYQLILPSLEFVGVFAKNQYKTAGVFVFEDHVAYLNNLGEKAADILNNFIFPETEFVILGNVENDYTIIKEHCKKLGVPLLMSDQSGLVAINLIYSYIANYLSPTVKVHGTLVSISGYGILLKGPSGIGKSEIALELIKRGHRLIADDTVVTYSKGISLHGRAVDHQKHLLEVRGIGIINIYRLYGLSAIKESCEINYIINLVKYDDIKVNDRIFDTIGYEEINGIKIPSIKLPVSSGRSLADIIEVSTLELASKVGGYEAANEFANEFDKLVKGE